MTINSEIKLCSIIMLNKNVKLHIKGPFLINQCWTNATVILHCVAIKIRYNIRHIKPYTSDKNVEDINPERYV